MRDFLLDLALNLKINIFAYEYSGYGQSEGSPSDFNCILDIKAAYDYLVNKLNFKWQNIYLYGQSIGSGPSVVLAAYHNTPVGGLILHSPITSGARMFDINVPVHQKSKIIV
eukprot:TRINITY_DN9954_c0_g1_i1.p1 TRINITY_DN9954_c0_g1~~TRINITY_DN9954_c0_g1_i1.p1  ORF type:complete len:112 (-),score=12.17 TRINITY_DN9954_c0_g1_i1:361-696(-)